MAEEIAGVKYGRAKLDPEAYAAQENETKRGGREGTVYGARKFADDPAATPSPDGEPETGRAPTGTLPSIPKLRDLLTKSPAQLDAAIEVELKTEKPRKGALQLFGEIESAKEEPRGDVLDRINAALSAFEE